MKRALWCAVVVIVSCGMAIGQAQYQVLWNFPEGYGPEGALVFDEAGNLYGTTYFGGYGGCAGSTCGTVFELSPNSNGLWSESTIYSFCQNNPACPDGDGPLAGLAIDQFGNLYGTTQYGGNSACYPIGCGVAFELSPPSGQGLPWTYSNLYTFCTVEECADGANPRSGTLTFDKQGNLYGTAADGGAAYNGGVVFQLTLAPGGWTENVLYSFCVSNGSCPDGSTPQSSVTFDKAGNLYGTTVWGGLYSKNVSAGGGTVFELSPGANGWTETVVYAFPKTGAFGSGPTAPVVFDPQGNLYSTSSGLDTSNPSGIFRLSRGGRLTNLPFDSGFTYSGVLLDAKREVLYGATTNSGNGAGTVYQVDRLGQLTVLHYFAGYDGEYPGTGGLIEDGNGNLYGVTSEGGAYGGGVVYELTPQ